MINDLTIVNEYERIFDNRIVLVVNKMSRLEALNWFKSRNIKCEVIDVDVKQEFESLFMLNDGQGIIWLDTDMKTNIFMQSEEKKLSIDICTRFSFCISYLFLQYKSMDIDKINIYRYQNVYKRYISLCDKITKALDDNCVMVYQRGKVGSLSICNSLDRCNILNSHLHKLNFLKPGRYLDYRLPYSDDCGFLNGNTDFIKNLIERIQKKKSNIVISGVRKPIQRDFADFFQALTFPFEPLCIAADELRFNDALLRYMDACYSFNEFDWYNEEIKEVFGIDVYDYSFDKESGFQVIEKGNTRLFLYRLENLSSLESELKLFVGDEQFSLINANCSYQKGYYFLYKQLRESNIIESERYEGNEMFCHFY